MPETAVTRIRHGSSIGQPLTRRDGLLKVTGAATYAADNHPEGLLHAVMAVSAIARGRVTHLDVAAAEAHPGVVAVMRPENAPKLAQHPDKKDNPFAFRLDLLQDANVRYANQPIAVVIAETVEAATEGARLLAPRYEAEAARTALDTDTPFVPPAVGAGEEPSASTGDVEAGLTAAARRIEVAYETPSQYHNAMEPHAIVAAWDGDRLTLDTPSQALAMAQGRIAGLFDIDPKNILIRSPFLGGGFGSKAGAAGPQVLGIMAAKLAGRPVKLVTRREQMFGPVGHRAQTRQTLRMGTDGEGRLTALEHRTLTASSTYDDFFEPSGGVSHTLYASPNISATHEAVRLDIGTPMFMRAPGEASGSAALESAVDEMAEACGMDPLAFRLKNYAEIEPISGKPFSSKALRECYAQGAERFGWGSRNPAPRSMRDEAGLLVGWGMGTATFPALMMQAEARAILRADGRGAMLIGAHDMGQGAWTALAQIAADSLGLDLDAVTFEMGSSDLPNAGIAGGSAHTATAGSAIHEAGRAVIAQLADLATNDEASPLFGAGNAGVIARDGSLLRRDDESRGERFSEILGRAGRAEIVATAKSASDPAARDHYAMHAHGAVFAEVKVDPELGQILVSRLVGAFAAGRIVNPRLVRSQYYGGMIWGVSFALHEHAVTDARSGRIMNASLAEYHVPVNADVPSIEAILVEEDDPHVNALGIKGVGEIGITGTAGAIANAIFHATGIRVREFPITLDRLLG
ncbi:xanthine dehydrogenase family protein molybdopterin-binding subunit [Methylobacterium haplocladii]|uniref:Dehydrogenase n=1 Tax=Methylobacterium haplocladii TaxID=1176176 RepID=A0A512ITB9_9HYPH|nr:xanthine dehydrogenase family protein molybdopterin-binding subunit [Methylobacterium haplocladii]GEP00954.1 dehydrogenase [Methylobacterium haplocladii]GJD84910.1 Aldehyde oxidoreductase molybdenum-binding subunit PaoC [Methylobacterium haplocladii]GLS58300.1 dehydrogenase [Methylobacterium haplocladii]